MMDTDSLSCVTCDKTSSNDVKIKKCGHCKTVGYCSIECQTKDWPNHKQKCSKFKYFCKKCHTTSFNKRKFKSCGGCGVRYCSKSCQKEDWIFHKQDCAIDKSNVRNKIKLTVGKYIEIVENLHQIQIKESFGEWANEFFSDRSTYEILLKLLDENDMYGYYIEITDLNSFISLSLDDLIDDTLFKMVPKSYMVKIMNWLGDTEGINIINDGHKLTFLFRIVTQSHSTFYPYFSYKGSNTHQIVAF